MKQKLINLTKDEIEVLINYYEILIIKLKLKNRDRDFMIYQRRIEKLKNHLN